MLIKRRNTGLSFKEVDMKEGSPCSSNFENDLPWKTVDVDSNVFFSENTGGFVMLEELDGYNFQVEDSKNGKIMKLEIPRSSSMPKKRKLNESRTKEIQNCSDHASLPEWTKLGVHPGIIQNLAALGFTKPTPIQLKAIPAAILEGKSVIGAAETGSGKTLAYGIPIIQKWIRDTDNGTIEKRKLHSLILAPTRELALQILKHLQAISISIDLKIMCLVGGMSKQKQDRLLAQSPEIVVATPGRLWEYVDQGNPHLASFDTLQCVVIDEADRMTEHGHFSELKMLFSRLNALSARESCSDHVVSSRLQYFIFSATLMVNRNKSQKDKAKFGRNPIEQVLNQLQVQLPQIIDLTPNHAVSMTLIESKILCMQEDKDVYLNYLLRRFPGRTLIFVNAIDTAKRLSSLLSLLDLKIYPIHAQMQQKQRLKNLDRMKNNDQSILIATDVAARGLDILDVRHVIHYHLPHSAETYVHRCGRTARAQAEGVSVALIAPEEMTKYKQICSSLTKANGIDNFPIDESFLPSLRKMVSLASRIEKVEHRDSKKRTEANWFRQRAEMADLAWNDSEDESTDEHERRQRESANQLKSLRIQLKSLLNQPLLLTHLSRSYPTSAFVRDSEVAFLSNNAVSNISAKELLKKGSKR